MAFGIVVHHRLHAAGAVDPHLVLATIDVEVRAGQRQPAAFVMGRLPDDADAGRGEVRLRHFEQVSGDEHRFVARLGGARLAETHVIDNGQFVELALLALHDHIGQQPPAEDFQVLQPGGRLNAVLQRRRHEWRQRRRQQWRLMGRRRIGREGGPGEIVGRNRRGRRDLLEPDFSSSTALENCGESTRTLPLANMRSGCSFAEAAAPCGNSQSQKWISSAFNWLMAWNLISAPPVSEINCCCWSAATCGCFSLSGRTSNWSFQRASRKEGGPLAASLLDEALPMPGRCDMAPRSQPGPCDTTCPSRPGAAAVYCTLRA